MKRPNLPQRFSTLLDKCNKHPRFLSVLGILPNQLRTILKESQKPNYEDILLDLSRSLFFSGYRIWRKRQELVTQYWKVAAPENRPLVGSRRRNLKKEVEKRKKIKLCRRAAEIRFIFCLEFGTYRIVGPLDVLAPRS